VNIPKLVKIAPVCISLSLLLSLAACGSGNPPSSSADGSSAGTAANETTPAEESYDPLGKYEPPITLTSVRSTLGSMEYPEGDDIYNNVWSREIENTLGIKINYNWTTDATQYANKLNVSIASGDIPDFFSCDSKTYVSLAKNGQIADLSDVYDKYASPELKSIMDSFPEGFDSGRQGGKLLALSAQGNGIIAIPDVVWIRDDWMKKLNLSEPKSMDDIVKIAEAFMAGNPDGQKGTYGIALTKGMSDGVGELAGIANAYHAYPGTWIKDASGEIVYGSVQPEMKNVLKVMQEWYKKGILKKEFGVSDINKVNEDIVSGKVGIEFGANWNCYWPFPDLVKKNIDAVFKPYAVPSADGKETKLQAYWPVSTYYVTGKNCKNPEALIKLANLFVKRVFNGTNEDNLKFNKDESQREVYKFAPVIIADPVSDYTRHVNISAAIKAQDPSKLDTNEKALYDAAIKWVTDKDPDAYGTYYQMGPEGSYSVLKEFVDQNRIMLTEVRGADTPALAEKKAILQKLEMDTFTNIILGNPIDKFDDFAEQWKKLGGEEVTKEVNEAFNK
jgi:putative aldouronate transport system substrate-binding protein